MSSILDDNLMAMGWYMRRTADSHVLGDFYTDVFKLPFLRGGRPWPVTMYWAGEATVFELKSDEAPMPERDQDPLTAPCTPVFRVHNLDILLEKLLSGGAKFVKEFTVPAGREVYILDPDGQLVALREIDRSSELSIDQEAWRRFDRGVEFNPDCDDMPKEIQCLDGIVMRVKDLAAMRIFYRDIIGFSEIHVSADSVVFDLGDNTYLELRGGGHAVPVPKDRVEVTNSFILRMQDTESFKNQTKAKGVHYVNEHIQWKRAHLAYFADPEGRIIGIEERYDPENYLEPVETYAEDLEAEKRFHERQND